MKSLKINRIGTGFAKTKKLKYECKKTMSES